MTQANTAIHCLSDLIRLDMETASVYRAALHRAESEAIAGPLRALAREHDLHVTELGAEVIALGGTPPRRQKQAPASTSSLDLRDEENKVHRAYADALASDLPPVAASVVRRHCEEEARHLALVDAVLSPEATKR